MSLILRPFQIGFTLLVIAFALQSQASSCRKLVNELKAMRLAERTLLSHMVQNNDSMASTLDQYAVELKESANRKMPVNNKEITGLQQSAEAFRQHKIREQKLIARFEEASDRLLNKVQSCLNQ